MFYSIKVKVITTFSLVMIIFTSILLLTIFLNERDRLLSLELEKSTEISRMHASILSQEFVQYISMLKMLSDDPQIKLSDKSAIDIALKRLMKVGNDNFVNAIYIDKNFNLTDAKGNTNKVSHPSFLHGEKWANKEYNITVPLHTRFEKDPVVIVGVPILDVDKKWLGNIAVAVSLSKLSKRLASIKLTKGSYAWLVDSNNLVVSHPLQQLVMKVNLSTNESVNFPGFHKVVKKIKYQSNGYGRYFDMQLNESKIITFSKVEFLPGWTLFVTTEESEIFEDIYEILYNILIIALVLMILCFLLISRLADKVTMPIMQLTQDVKASVNTKNNVIRIIHANDEIGALSKAFHSSFQKINAYTSRLEEMVNRRTKEVSIKNVLLSEQNIKLEELVSKDPLTQLYNRRAFYALVETELSRAKRHHFSIALAVLDIDHFKKINDQYGHNVGDQVLRRFADELSLNMRKEDLICRWGGEEFVILLSASTTEKVFNHMEEVRKKISNMQFDAVNQVTFSTGMSTLREGEEFKQWFKRADQAMYKAKETGRNRIVTN